MEYLFYLCVVNEESPYRVVPQKVKKGTRLVAVAGNPIDVVNRSTGEVMGATPYVGKRVVRDISDFVKLYDVSVLVDMTPTEVKVFSYVLKELDFGGMILFAEDKCMAYTGLTRSAVYRGLDRLVERDIVKRGRRGVYWINVNVAYRGNRDELMNR